MYLFFNYDIKSNFMEIFNLVNHEGDAWCYVADQKSDEKMPEVSETLDKLSSALTSMGYCFFSVAQNVPELAKQVDPVFKEDGGNNICIFKLAPVLGLPGLNHKEELDELKKFFEFIKNELMKDMTQVASLQLSRGFGETNVRICSNDSKFGDKLHQDIHEKIAASPVLTQWLTNQKEGITKSQPHLDNLFANLPIYSFLNEAEQDEYFKVQSAQNKAQKKNKGKMRR